MNELGYPTETTEPATPGVGAGDTPDFGEADLAGEYDGNLDAILAAKGKLPTRQEDFNDTWGDSPEWFDEADLDDEDDGDLDAVIAARGQGPTRQEDFNATWGDSPQWPDETDLDDEDDGDLDAVIAARGQGPTRQEDFNATWGDSPQWPDETDPDDEDDGDLDATTAEENGPARPDAQGAPAEPASPPEETVGTNAQDTGSDGQDAASTAGPQPERLGTGPATAEPDLAPETDTTGEGTDTQAIEPDHPEPPGTEASESMSPEAVRVKTLEAELNEARQKIAELEAENSEQPVLSHRAGQQLADTDRDPGDASTPDHGADAPVASPDQDAPSPSIAERRNGDEPTDTVDVKPSRLRRVVSATNVAVTGALIDAADTAAKFALHATPLEVAIPMVASLLGLGAVGLDKLEKRRKGKP